MPMRDLVEAALKMKMSNPDLQSGVATELLKLCQDMGFGVLHKDGMAKEKERKHLLQVEALQKAAAQQSLIEVAQCLHERQDSLAPEEMVLVSEIVNGELQNLCKRLCDMANKGDADLKPDMVVMEDMKIVCEAR